MNKSQLIEELAMRMGLTINSAKTVVSAFFDSIADGLAQDDRAEIRGLGSFKVKSYDGYIGRNPKTGEPSEIKPKKLPSFKAGKELKKRVDDTDPNRR
ncbi:MAG: integration host factor subunit beta [Deltaproteobacteria bacterium]|nr:integration host factor subunit beta [Deltaproteobacteria bacterium]MBW2053669.1 integration host factor subunit beta [Deltaproteobacteria bacterium]MBW2142259.1 integration host factor subunit beta [Deltaproteobacteria bacterium]MBW2324363.1 integration host factor subunit beta [Deltaproteobacteria bacterium]